MVCSPDFSLLRDLFLILLFQMPMWGSDSFSVTGPSEPIVAMLGADTVLPCRVYPAMNVESMEIRWFRNQFSEAVFVYQNGMEQVGEQLVDFKGRAELVKDYITEGRVAVRIHSLRVSDNGMYKCFFKKGTDFEEAILELKVIGLGSDPRVFLVGPEDGGIRLKCTGKGWFPQPEVQWEDAKGEKIPSVSEDEIQDDDGLFQIEASLIVRDSSKTQVSCSMKNPFFGQEQVETIFIPESFFPRPSPWKAAFVVILVILGISVGAIVYLTLKERRGKKKLSEIKGEKEEESKAKESLERELAKRKELYQQDWRKAELYADWRKEQFKAVAFTLKPETAHPNLVLSENKQRISLKNNVPQNGDASTHEEQGESEAIFSVLGEKSLTMERQYWEVEVNMRKEDGSATRWALGICSETAKREGWFVERPEKHFWVLIYKEGEVIVPTSQKISLSLRQQLHRIGVFLDWEARNLSFYNMADGSHIYSFTGIAFCGNFFPYFSLRGTGTSLTICSTSDHPENCPDSSPKTSLTHLSSCETNVPQESNSLL
ncbi:butyrophilin subfamily 3 member A2-like isoform 1-T2 [Dama dama]|uniref:butyrophilin subfamily 1 member A1-like n=1 Tax=Dama dama TaxID=30532 RepID=UPI002A35BFE1|nr:butyrophilin subfamily 1 member A1-like [Dama dama]XP_061002937.1 butyrophilin subfamily 1 member A1-like [Dama dama]